MRLVHEPHREIALSARKRPVRAPSFEALYRDHHAFVWRCARSLGVGESMVDDVVQDTFVVALRRLEAYDPRRASVTTWLFSILRNVIRNRARGDRRRTQRHARFADWRALVDESPDARGILGRRILAEFLDDLEPKRREVFVLADLEGMRPPEIAAALECNLNTVYSRLRAARACFEVRFGAGAQLPATREPSASQRRRSWAIIAGAGGLELPGGAVGAKLGLGVWVGGWGATTKLALAAAASLVTTVVVLGAVSAPDPGEAAAVSDSAADSGPVVEDAAGDLGVAALAPETGIVVAAPAKATRAAQRARPKSPPITRSREALVRLDGARRDLDEGRAAAALEALNGAPWPSHALEGRARVLEVEALCGLGREPQAHARAQAWVRAHPEGLTAAQLDGACREP